MTDMLTGAALEGLDELLRETFDPKRVWAGGIYHVAQCREDEQEGAERLAREAWLLYQGTAQEKGCG